MSATNYSLLQPLKKFQGSILGSRSSEGASLEWLRRCCRKGELRAVKVSSDWFTTEQWINDFNLKRIGEPSAQWLASKSAT